MKRVGNNSDYIRYATRHASAVVFCNRRVANDAGSDYCWGGVFVMRYASKWPEYSRQWDHMAIKQGRLAEFNKLAQFAVDHKPIYQVIEQQSGVTWPHIAVLHRRESDADFHTYLGNGESLERKTRLVPRGRGPFKTAIISWEDAFIAGALDALKIDGLSSIQDWKLEKILYYCEIFNGTGYDRHGRPSPYIWGGTSIQARGKYVADGKWNGSVWDGQPGCAPILAMIAKADPSVKLTRES